MSKKNSITQADYARVLGVSRQAIHKLVEKRVLTEWNDLGSLMVQHIQHLTEVAAGRQSDQSEFDLIRERGRLAARQAEKIEIELAKLRGELITEAVVAEYFSYMLFAVRAKLLALPSRYRSQFPTLTPRQVDVLDNYLREALQELAIEKFPREIRGSVETYFEQLRNGLEREKNGDCVAAVSPSGEKDIRSARTRQLKETNLKKTENLRR